MVIDTDEWRELAKAAQAGDKRAYGRLLSEIAPFVTKSVIAGLASPSWAEDITQEVLISVHKSLHTYSPERPFRPWLMAIVQFRRTDFLRKHYAQAKYGRVSLDHPEFIRSQVTNPTHSGEYRDIVKLLAELPRKQRDIFVKIRVQGHSVTETAQQMKMNESAVKVSLHRTLIKLRSRMEEA